MRRRATIFLATGFLASTPAKADELAGHVLVVGSSVNMKVQLTEKNGSSGPSLCKNDVANRIKKLLRLEIRVSGDWQKKADGSNDCFMASSFTILRHSSGRVPVVGLLQEEGATFVVKSDDGKVSRLSDITTGLKRLKGRKVILDLKPMDTPGQKDVSFKVVAYSEYP